MDVSVIIVNYNTSDMVLNCIDSVLHFTELIQYEIIVVDNGSTAAEIHKLHSARQPFSLIESPDNLGFGRANNLGAASASGDYLFLLNPDTLLQNNAIHHLFSYMKNHSDCGICGGNLFHADGSEAHSFHIWFPSILSEMDFASGQLLRRLLYGNNAQFNHSSKPLNVAMITGADLMIRHDVWKRLDGFDPRFFMYCEDADLCLRTNRLGLRVVCIPDSQITHLEGKSFVETASHCRRILDGRNLYFHKHYSPSYNHLADFFNILTLSLAVFICRLTGRREKENRLSIRLTTYKELIQQ